MRDCWKQEAGERPTFSELHKVFDRFLKQQTQDQYPYIMVLSNPYSLEPEQREVEQTPINLDMELMDATTTGNSRNNDLVQGASLNQLSRLNPADGGSQNSFAQMSLDEPHHHLRPSSMQNENSSQEGERNIEEDDQEVVHNRYVELPTRVNQESSLTQQ